MSFEEDTINPIINFLHKLLGKNLWILPVALAFSSGYIYLYVNNTWWLLYIAIICSLISILYFLSISFVVVKNTIKHYNDKKAADKAFEKKQAQEKDAKEQKVQEHNNIIWKFVAHLDSDLITAATLFLQLDIHDDDKYTRYVKIPTNGSYKEHELYQACLAIVNELTFQKNIDYPVRMIEYEQVNQIVYFYIEPYFFSLVENYKTTAKWTKV